MRTLSLLAALLLAGHAAHATPTITTFAQYSVGPLTDADGPVVQQPGDPPLTSSVTTTSGASLCGITGSCAPGANANANAVASQRNTADGVFSGLVADATFYNGSSTVQTLTSRTTWEESPSVAGPNSITLFIKPGELVLSDFAGGVGFLTTISARFRIELTVNGATMFFSEAILQGAPGGPTLTESGTDLGGTAFAHPVFGNDIRGYAFDALLTTIALGNLTTSDVVRYTMEVSVSGPGFETGGFARVGDPFDLAGGGGSIAFVNAPEPSGALLLGVAGALGLAGFGRRRT